MCAENSLSYNSSSNIQHVNPYSSAISLHYVVPPQDMSMNKRIDYDDVNYLANYSLNSAPYANAHINNLASCLAQSSSRIHEISARCANVNTQNLASCVAQSSSQIDESNTHNSASCFTTNSSRINKNLAWSMKAISYDSAKHNFLKTGRIDEDLAHTRNPYGSSKWKVPTYHRPYPLQIDYFKTPDGWWIPDFYEFSGEDDKTAVEHINVYISQLGFAGKKDYMRIHNFSLSLTGIDFAWFTSLPRCTVGSWSQLEKFYEFFFEKTNEKKPITIETLAKAGLLDPQKKSLTTEKYGNVRNQLDLTF
jgi:hypothetical protein